MTQPFFPTVPEQIPYANAASDETLAFKAYDLELVIRELADDGTLIRMKEHRYSGWEGDLGHAITDGTTTLAELADRVENGEINPDPVSGKQELYENIVNDALWA